MATGATTGSVRAMAADATSLYLAGDEGSGINTQWRIEKRLLADGSLDPAFGAAGVVTINPAGGDDFPNALVIDATSLYVGGVDSGGDGSRRRIEKRALSDGTPDAAFGAAGVLTADLPGAEAVGGLGLDATSLYVGGSDSSAGSPRWRIEKRNLSDGALDAAFGTAGVVIPVLSGFGGGITAITLEGTAFYASGYEDLVPTPLAESQWRIEKRNASDGSPVAAFGTGGVVTRNRTNRTDVPHAAAAGAAGLMVVGEGNTSTHAWQLELFTSAAGATIWSR
ncbi:MAG: hypothetical protein HY293_14480 [Planctomycetes bacterium]|nr:hypothetical protein [Planctomycetota bacterium]